jgi:hypothetical protein
MNEEKLKSAVLAKCEELWKSYPDDEIGGHCVWKNTGGWFDVRNETRTIRLECNPKIPETDEIWQLAAQILGIKQPEPLPLPQAIANIATDALGLPRVLVVASNQPLRPFDALLWEAFEMHAPREWVMLDEFMGHKNVPCTQVRASSKKRFSEWLATLPTDTLKADRELVADAFYREDLERDLLNECYNYELINAVKRLAGMEVKNE